MTKRELIVIREHSYRVPLPEQRCENCRYFMSLQYHESGACRAIEIRGTIQRFCCQRGGVCDLWESKEPKPEPVHVEKPVQPAMFEEARVT